MGVTLHIEVEHSGRPVPGLILALRYGDDGPGGEPLSRSTGESGVAVFEGLGGGRSVQIASTSAFDPIYLRLPATGRRDVRLRVGAASRREVRVLDERSGEPIVGARISIGGLSAQGLPTAVTDERGEAWLTLHTDDVAVLFAEADGYASGSTSTEDGALATIQLGPGSALAGVLAVEDGSPVEGGVATLVPAVREQSDVGVFAADPPARHVSSTEAGRFEFRDVDRRIAWVVLAVHRERGLRGARVVLPRESGEDIGRIRMSPSASVRVDVVEADGAPIPNAVVELTAMSSDRVVGPDQPSFAFPAHILRTDSNGTCTASAVAPGRCGLAVSAGSRSVRSFMDVPLAGGVSERVIMPRSEFVAVSVVDRDRIPQADVPVLATGRGGFSSFGVTDDQGVVSVARPPSPARVQVPSGFLDGRLVRSEGVDLGGSDSVELTIERVDAVRGRLLDDRGESVAGARLMLVPAAGRVVEVAASMDGRYVVESAADRDWIVFLGERVTSTGPVESPLAALAPANSSIVRCWRVGPPESMTIELVDADGGPLVGWAVQLAAAGDLSPRQDERARSGVTDERGFVRFDDVADLPLSIRVRERAPGAPTRRFVMRRAEHARLDVTAGT